MELDHLILPVTDMGASLQFYTHVLDIEYGGRVGPFEVLKIKPGLNIDLMRVDKVEQPGHLAFRLSDDEFALVMERLHLLGIDYGPSPFDRSRRPPVPQAGACGMADSLYFFDPDKHNIEIRVDGLPNFPGMGPATRDDTVRKTIL